VFLDDVLTTMPAAPLPHVRVADAPAVGKTASLTRADVNAWIQAHAPDLHSTNWAGLDQVRITRRVRSLDEVELRELLGATLQRDVVGQKGELELRLTRAWNSIQVPDESLNLRVVDLPATGPSANFIVRFELWNGEERLGQWQVSAAAKIWRDVPVAQVPLKRGQLLSAAPISFERRDVLALRDAPGLFALDDPTLELVENTPAGHAVLARSVRPRPVVFRGQTVDAVIQDGALMISLRVETLQDGLPGQLVRVRNPRTRRELTGKVLDEQTILIGR
jgi:flagella basal body P-ring formation protein FlgA